MWCSRKDSKTTTIALRRLQIQRLTTYIFLCSFTSSRKVLIFFSKNRAARGSDDGDTISSPFFYVITNQWVRFLFPKRLLNNLKNFIQKEGKEEDEESLREISIWIFYVPTIISTLPLFFLVILLCGFFCPAAGVG